MDNPNTYYKDLATSSSIEDEYRAYIANLVTKGTLETANNSYYVFENTVVI
jgi:hypothetical protein